MSKHTPGPWAVGLLPIVNGKFAGHDWIAPKAGPALAVMVGGGPADIRAANAALIAQSPTMLSLLQRFADLMDGEQGTVEYCTGMEALRADVEQVLQQHGRGQG